MNRPTAKAALWLCLTLFLAVSYPVAAQDPDTPTDLANRYIYLPLVRQPGSRPISQPVQPPNSFFVDSVNGLDSNPGTSETQPWKSLGPVNRFKFPPGSVIQFKRGGVWAGQLLIDDSGTPDLPIRFTAYGSGEPPTFNNPGDSSDRGKVILIASNWVIVEELRVENSSTSGVEIRDIAEHNVVRNLEIYNTGFGVTVYGKNNLVTGTYIHDLHIVKNTSGGLDDYGAVGVVLSGPNNEISYNRMVNCLDDSYDFGQDGGAVEWWGNADGNNVHHNWAEGNDGFLEVGGGSAQNTTVAYNVSVDNQRFSVIHVTGPNASSVQNFRMENNTIIETSAGVQDEAIFYFDAAPPTSVQVHNNLVYAINPWKIANYDGFTHNNNLFYFTGRAQAGFALGTGELLADPQFVNQAGRDFRLSPGSPAIDAGLSLGHSKDMDGRGVPAGTAPDIGAFEWQP